MTLRHLKIFVAVCKFKGITAAAKKLHLTQPSVSLAIKELENHYGVRLFDRIAHRIYLTESGRQFLIYATQIVSLFDGLENEMRLSKRADIVRVGASITTGAYLLPQFVSDFSRQYPHISVHATIENSEKLEHRILENDIDFAIIEGPIHNTQLKSEKLMDDRLVLICGQGHPLASASRIRVEQFQNYDFILREKGSGTRELFDSTLLIHGITIKPIWESVSTHAIINAVSEGLGLSVLSSRMIQPDLRAGRIKTVEVSNVQFQRPFSIIYHKDKFLSNGARAFLELCRARCPKRSD